VLFNWLAWKNKILTLENLSIRRCNKLPTATCVFCHAEIESINHIFLNCGFGRVVWDHFGRLLGLPESPLSMFDIWYDWRENSRPAVRFLFDLVVKALLWNIWLARNERMFNANFMSVTNVILRIDRMLLAWFNAIADGSKEKIGEAVSTVKRNLDFLETRVAPQGGSANAEEAFDEAMT